MRKVLFAWTWWVVGVACVLAGIYFYSKRLVFQSDSRED